MGDILVAFVAMDGPGAEMGLREQAHHSTGRPSWPPPSAGGYWGSLPVIAFGGASATNVTGAAGAPSGPPSIYLPSVATGSWVFAVGNDWDGATSRAPAAGQTVEQELHAPVGTPFWVQRTATPSITRGLLTIADTAPADHQWNYAAVEVSATPASQPISRTSGGGGVHRARDCAC